MTPSGSMEKAALVVLLRSRGRVPHLAERLEQRGSAIALLEEEWGVDRGQPRLFNEDGPDMTSLLDNTAAQVDRWETAGMQMLTPLDSQYPANLRAVHDRPPLIFVAGALESVDDRLVAVIGARMASADGLAAARATAGHLAACGYTVVSGLAAGIDRAAHEATLGCRRRTVAVIGTGLARCYPRQNAALQKRIARNGAVVSRFWPDDPPSRQSFPIRNALMSGIALATVVIEAGAMSGARLQARMAVLHGRPVFLFEPVLAQPWASELASQPGTHVVRSPEEITGCLERLAAGALAA